MRVHEQQKEACVAAALSCPQVLPACGRHNKRSCGGSRCTISMYPSISHISGLRHPCCMGRCKVTVREKPAPALPTEQPEQKARLHVQRARLCACGVLASREHSMWSPNTCAGPRRRDKGVHPPPPTG